MNNMLLIMIAYMNLGLSIVVAITHGPHMGVMCAMVSHVIFRGMTISPTPNED